MMIKTGNSNDSNLRGNIAKHFMVHPTEFNPVSNMINDFGKLGTHESCNRIPFTFNTVSVLGNTAISAELHLEPGHCNVRSVVGNARITILGRWYEILKVSNGGDNPKKTTFFLIKRFESAAAPLS